MGPNGMTVPLGTAGVTAGLSMTSWEPEEEWIARLPSVAWNATLVGQKIHAIVMAEKKAIVMVPEDEAFTTQAAANYLGVSRQHLVNLLEKGEIAYHKVGTHRRVTFKDLLAYEKKRDQVRREAMDRLTDQVIDAGLYFPDRSEGE